jgi:hypothetical protein
VSQPRFDRNTLVRQARLDRNGPCGDGKQHSGEAIRKADEMANAIVFLASDEATFTLAAIVDGGMSNL